MEGASRPGSVARKQLSQPMLWVVFLGLLAVIIGLVFQLVTGLSLPHGPPLVIVAAIGLGLVEVAIFREILASREKHESRHRELPPTR